MYLVHKPMLNQATVTVIVWVNSLPLHLAVYISCIFRTVEGKSLVFWCEDCVNIVGKQYLIVGMCLWGVNTS